MRLELRRKLHPYRDLRELADALDVSVPALKRSLHELEARGELSLSGLARDLGVPAPARSEREDDLYLAFHRRHLCLVCGSGLEQATGRQAGWGEFLQCTFCDFSMHENADFLRSREAAQGAVKELREAAEKAHRILSRRKEKGSSL